MRDYTVWTRIMGVVRSETMIWRIFATLWAGPTGVQRKALLVCFVRDVPGLYPKSGHTPLPPFCISVDSKGS